jgi:hypothetical protein
MAINTSTNPKLLWPGQKELWGKWYNQYSKQYTEFMDVIQSAQAFEEMQGVLGFGLMPTKTEGAAYIVDTESAGYNKRYTAVTYALGYEVTLEEIEDNLYQKASSSRMPALANSMRQTVETKAANVLNNGFSSTYLGADGVELFSSLHPNVNGGTWANEPSVQVDLSEAALEDASIAINQWTDDRGLKINASASKVIVHPNDEFNIQRILNSTLRSGTANNDVNAMKDAGSFPGGYAVNNYLSAGSGEWFIKTDVANGLTHVERKAATVDQSNDFSTKNLLVSGLCRFDTGWTDARGAYGSSGTP